MWDREVWDASCERMIAALLLGGVAANALFFGGVLNPEFGFAIVAALAIWIARFWLSPNHRLLLHPVLVPGLIFVAYGAWRCNAVTVPYASERELLQITLVSCTLILGLHNLQRQETCRWVAHLLAILGCGIAAYAVFQLLRESNTVLWLRQPEGYAKRAGGTFINPNHLAGFLCVLVPLSLSVVFLSREKPLLKVLHAYASLVMLAGVAATMSRGGWTATALGVFVLMAWILRSQRSLRIPAAMTAAFLLFAGGSYLGLVDKARSRLTNISAEGNIDAGSSRLWLWRPAVAMWRDHPLVGVGPAHFDIEFPPYRPWQIQVHPGYTHNEYLSLLVEYGVVGAAIGLAALVIFSAQLVRTARYVERGSNDLGQRLSNRGAIFVGSTAGLSALGFHCLVDFDLHIPAISLLAALIGGLLASHLRFATERLWLNPGIWGRGVLTVGGCAILSVLTIQLSRAAREAYHLNQAAGADRVDAALIAHLKTAAEICPNNPRTAFELGENYRRLSFKGGRKWKEQGIEATNWLGRSLAINPKEPETWLSLARTHQWLGDTRQAADEFDRALALGPNSVEVANLVGWNFLTRGRTNEAKALFDQSVRWNWYNNPMAISKKAELEATGYR